METAAPYDIREGLFRETWSHQKKKKKKDDFFFPLAFLRILSCLSCHYQSWILMSSENSAKGQSLIFLLATHF